MRIIERKVQYSAIEKPGDVLLFYYDLELLEGKEDVGRFCRDEIQG